jgi:flagellar hook-length control protein FliK
VPRVASETSNIQPHHHAVGSRRQPDAEAKQRSSSFDVLLDDTGKSPPPTPHDPSERARPSSASTTDTQGGRRTQGGQEHGGDRAENRNETADTPQPAPDKSTEANADTPASAADAKSAVADAADGRGGKDKLAQVDVTEIALLAAAAPADAAATQQPVASEQAPATATIVPAVALPAVAATADANASNANASNAIATAANATAANASNANSTNAIATDADASSAATVEAAALPGAQAQPAGKTGAGETGAQNAADANAGRNGNVAASGADGSNPLKADNTFDANKTLRPKQATSAGTKTPGTTEAAASNSAGDAAPQAGPEAAPNPTDKSEPALVHSNHAVGQTAEPKPGETVAQLRAEAQVGSTADASKPAADAVQLAPLQHPADRFANLVAGAAQSGATATDQAAVPIAGLAVEITARAQAGGNRFEIRLDPPELGRIDVRLDIDRDGNVTSRLMVEKAETLDLLRRDAPALERALQQAGLKTDDSGLQFALRDQSFGGQNQDTSDGARSGAARLVVPDPEMAPVDTVQGGYGRSPRLGGGIDIRV